VAAATSVPPAVPGRIHGMDQDPIFGLEGDLDAAATAQAVRRSRELLDRLA